MKFFFSKRSISEIYKEIFDEHPTLSHIGTFMGRPVLIIKDTKDLQSVLQSDFQNFNSRGINSNPNDILSDNVLFMENYGRWKLLRHKLSPIFTRTKLKNMFYIMDRCAQDFITFIEDNKCVERDTYNTLYNYTTSSIGAALFGIDAQTKSTMNSPFISMARSSIEPSLKANLKALISNVSPTLFYLLDLKLFGDHEEFFIGTVKRVLEMRRREGDKDKRHDFIDMCLELQSQGIMQDATTGYELEATDEVLAAQAFFFFLAGVDTSASTMHFTLLELASNPDVLTRVHNEIDKMFDESNGKLTYEGVEKLEYLDMVLSESLRKYPPIGAIQRRCTNSTILPSGIKIEKDDIVVIPIYALHRDEKLFPRQSVFDPERFSPENVSKIAKFSYLPFGEGNRMCLGTRFSRVQIKSGLAWLLRKYTLKEKKYEPISFAQSLFSVRDEKANFELIRRLGK
ncbi:unnamed protein product, partial [Brenthis ino]